MYPDYTRHIERLPRFTPFVPYGPPRSWGKPEYGYALGTDYWIVFSYKTMAIVWRARAWGGIYPASVAERLNQ